MINESQRNTTCAQQVGRQPLSQSYIRESLGCVEEIPECGREQNALHDLQGAPMLSGHRGC